MALFGGARTVSVALEAKVTGYLAGFKAATAATKNFADAAAKTSQKHKAAWGDVGSAALKAGALVGVGVGLAVKTFVDFDKAMSRAAAGTRATGVELTALRAAAIKAGADTQFSAVEAADAITALGKAGISTNDILSGGLKGSLSLAAAGELNVGQAAEIAATALTQFGLKGKDIPHVADLLAAGAGKAQGEVSDLSEALKYVGPVAHGMGVSIEETTGTLAEFAAQGIIGEQAGTGLRGVLSTISSPSRQAAKEMKALGINVYDANGKFIGLAGVAGQLHGALSGMTQAQRDAALGIIFGNEQLTAARVLYQGGAQSVQKWTAAVNDQGFASEQAARLTDNLSGDIERLGGSLSSAFITTGSGANASLRGIVQTAESAVNLFNGMPGPLQQTALGLAAAAAGALLLAGGTAKAVGGVVSLKTNLATLGVTSTRVRAGVGNIGSFLGGPWGLALTAATIGLGLFAAQQAEASQRAQELRDSLDEQSGAVTDNTKTLVAHKLQTDGVLDQARALGLSLSDVTDAALGDELALRRLDSVSSLNVASLGGLSRQLPAASGGMDALSRAALANGGALGETGTKADAAAGSFINLRAVITQQSGDIAQQAAAVKQEAEARGVSTTAADQNKAAQSALSVITEQTTEQNRKAKAAQDALTASLDKTKNAFLELRGGQRGYEAALDATTASLKQNGKTLDVHTEKGRANADALDSQAGAALDYLRTLDSQHAPAAAFNKTLDETRANLEKSARSFGLSRSAAKDYVDRILTIPGRVDTAVTQPGIVKAQSDTKALTSFLKAVPLKSVTNFLAPGLAAAIAMSRDYKSGVLAVPTAQITAFQQPGLAAGIAQSQALQDKLHGVPGQVNTQINLQGILAAITKTETLAQDLRGIDGKVVETRIVTKTTTAGGATHFSSVGAKATGGQIPAGIGTPGRDSVHALVMPREFIQPTASVDYYGLGFMEAVRTRSLPRFADGGYVARSMPSTAATAPTARGGGDTYIVNASTTEAAAIVREQQYQRARLDAVRGRG